MLTCVIWGGGALFLRYTEGAGEDPNEAFSSISGALWNTAVCLFSGLDSSQPQTAPGKVVTTAVLVLSAGVVAILTGEIASFLVGQQLGSLRRMPNRNMKDHVVICNWSDKGAPMIRELHADIVKTKRPVVIVAENLEPAALPEAREDPAFDQVYLLKGDPTKEATLRQASVHLAHSVVVLADPADGDMADAKSILVVMTARYVCGQAGGGATHICVEGVAAGHGEHLRRAGADEIVSASEFATMLLAQAARFHNLSKVYSDLLTNSEATNEVYFVPIPQQAVNMTFGELRSAVDQAGVSDEPVTLIGVKSGGRIIVNPRPREADRPLVDADEAIVLAYRRPDALF